MDEAIRRPGILRCTAAIATTATTREMVNIGGGSDVGVRSRSRRTLPFFCRSKWSSPTKELAVMNSGSVVRFHDDSIISLAWEA